jgi:phage baseplate assembly protein W
MAYADTVKNTDFDLKFTKRQLLGKKTDIRTLVDNHRRSRYPVIEQSIANIVLTNKGERPFQPDFGGNIYDTLFEQIPYFGNGTSALEINITERIKAALINYEPRVAIMSVSLTPDKDSISLRDQKQARIVGGNATSGSTDKNLINIQVVYRVIPMTEVLTYNLKIKRVR